MRRVVLLSIVIVFAVAAFGADYVPAYYRAGEVCFNAPLALDGEQLAKEHFRLFPLANPDRQKIAEVAEGAASARFPFPAPLDDRLHSSAYFVIHERGIEILHLKRLEGSVVYDSPDSATHRVEVMTCGAARSPVEGAGFVVIVKRRVRDWSVSRLDAGTVAIPESSTSVHAVRAAFTFIDPDDGVQYALVRRVADTQCQYACCESSYDLFTFGAAMTLVLSNSYDCDV